MAARGRLRLAFGVAALGLGLSACSATSTAAPPISTPVNHPATISIENFAYHPDTLRVKPGATVTVVNRDGVTHTLTSLTGAFNTGDISAGQTVHFTAPTKAGSYPYRCNIHEFMTGNLIVAAN